MCSREIFYDSMNDELSFSWVDCHCHGIGGYGSGMVDRGGLEVTIDERGVCCLFRG